MELLLSVVIVGMAAGYVTELAAMLYDRPWIRVLLTLTSSAGALYLLGFWAVQLAIGSLAAAFLSAMLLKLTNRPVVVNNALRR